MALKAPGLCEMPLSDCWQPSEKFVSSTGGLSLESFPFSLSQHQWSLLVSCAPKMILVTDACCCSRKFLLFRSSIFVLNGNKHRRWLRRENWENKILCCQLRLKRWTNRTLSRDNLWLTSASGGVNFQRVWIKQFLPTKKENPNKKKRKNVLTRVKS